VNVKRSEETTAEADGWFTVSRAATLLGVPVPRIFDQIRDGKLQVRFEPGDPGGNDRPFVTSTELKQKTAAVAPPGPPAAAAIPAPVAARTTGNGAAPLDEAQRTIARLEGELRETRATLDQAEERLDASLKAIYERDVQIARLEAELAARSNSREDAENFIRHLEVRLDKTEDRSEEKEKEIRRLAVGLGEARGEIKMLNPPAPEPPPAWRRHVGRVFTFVMVLAGAGCGGWIAYALAAKALPRESGLAAGVAVLAAFTAGFVLERLRQSPR
jgi:flagellar biosynthesis chaperone FliJ